MCSISDKIKFCTCENSEINEKDNYWILNRSSNGNIVNIIGDVLIPYMMDKIKYNETKKFLSKRLSDSDVFDFEIDFKENDYLEIILKQFPNPFIFSFSNNKWQFESDNISKLPNDYIELKSGIIKNNNK